MASTSGFRGKFAFWLNHDKPREARLAQWMEQVKRMRLFSRAMRDGFELWYDLYINGSVEVLKDMFPFVADAFRNTLVEGLMQVIADQRKRIAELEALLGDGVHIPSAPAKPKAATALEFTFSEATPAVNKSGSSAKNLIASMDAFD